MVLLVALGGPSSSGKTTVASALHHLLANSTLVHLDDFYFPNERIPVDPETGEQNWDVPEAIDFALFADHITNLKRGDPSTAVPSLEGKVDLVLSPPEIARLRNLLPSVPIVLVDGFMLYHDAANANLFDIRCFFHAPYSVLKHRRASRQGYNTVGGFWVDPPGYFDDIVWPAYEKNHRHLFNNNDVNSTLNTYAKETLKLVDFANDGSKSLEDLVREVIELIKRATD